VRRERRESHSSFGLKPRVGLCVAVFATVAAVGACSSSSAGATTTNKPNSPAASSAYRRPACHVPAAPRPVQAVAVAGVANGWTITSFDGTKIRAYWFPVQGTGSRRYPTVLMGPGWGETADTSPSGAQLFGGLSIDTFHAAGFNVMTWDPRGFGPSGGLVELDSIHYEARDVAQLIDWLATLPGVQLNAPNDPAVGMVGGSYGGGIQFTSAALDCRIDAIVPEIAWHSLPTSLFTNRTVKAGWGNLLLQIAPATGMHLDPRITASASAITTGVPTPAELQFEASAGPGNLVSHITAPTLIVQGTADNLFPLEEGVTNYQALRAKKVPVNMIWFCGGHGICLTPPGNQNLITKATLAWLDRWVKGQKVSTGTGFDFVDQDGNEYSALSYPIPLGTPLRANGSGTLTLVASGSSGPAHVPAGGGGLLGSVAASITPATATHAVNVVVSPRRRALVVGAPRITLTYSGTSPPGSRPTRVFAQVEDDSTGLLLGNQVTPIPVTLDGRTHTVSLPLEMVVAALRPGHRLTLQLCATTVAFATPRLGGSITFSRISLSLPVSAHIQPR
jgi:ABC-2 type transport system ATP-binding protein